MQYKIVEADLERDGAEIISLWKRNFTEFNENRYSWLYGPNSQGGMIWLLLDEKEKVIGTAGITLRNIIVSDQKIVAAQAIDFAVDKNYRVLGPAMQLQKRLIKAVTDNGIQLLYGFPMKTAELIEKRAGYRELGTFQRWTKILNLDDKLKKHISSKLLRTVISVPINGALQWKFGELKLNRQSNSGTRLSGFDHQFDGLFEKAAKQFGVIGERTSRYLNWRFIQSPEKNYQIFGLIQEQSLCGYIIYRIRGKFISVSDLLALDKYKLKSLLLEFCAYSRTMNVNSIVINLIGPASVTEQMRQVGFIKRPANDKVLTLPTSGWNKKREELENSEWYITVADRDV